MLSDLRAMMKNILIGMACLLSLSACSSGSDAAGEPAVELEQGQYSFKGSGAKEEQICLSSNIESAVRGLVETWLGDENVTADCSLENFKLTGNAFSGRAMCDASPTRIAYEFTGDRSTNTVNLDGEFKHSIYTDEEGAATEDMVGEEVSFNAPLTIAASRQGLCP
jgi:hypothetical protein